MEGNASTRAASLSTEELGRMEQASTRAAPPCEEEILWRLQQHLAQQDGPVSEEGILVWRDATRTELWYEVLEDVQWQQRESLPSEEQRFQIHMALQNKIKGEQLLDEWVTELWDLTWKELWLDEAYRAPKWYANRRDHWMTVDSMPAGEDYNDPGLLRCFYIWIVSSTEPIWPRWQRTSSGLHQLRAVTSGMECLFKKTYVDIHFNGENAELEFLKISNLVRNDNEAFEDYEYFHQGDFIIGGLFTVNSAARQFKFNKNPRKHIVCLRPSRRNYVNVLLFIFAIKEINTNPDILQNITLGYHAYDTCLDTRKAVKSVLQILSGPGKIVPNYSCLDRGMLVGFIGDHYSITTLPIAQILGVYGYAQISYGATDYVLSDKQVYPHFFRMLQNDHVHHLIIAKLLKYFGWTWVGIIASLDISGQQESRSLTNYMISYGICVAYTLQINIDLIQNGRVSMPVVQMSSVQVVIICGSFSLAVVNVLKRRDVLQDQTIIFSTSWASNSYLLDSFTQEFYFSLAIELYPITIPGTELFFNDIHSLTFPNDMLLEELWLIDFYCLLSNTSKHAQLAPLLNIPLRNCTGKERIDTIKNYLFLGVSPRVFYAVEIISRALNDMNLYFKYSYCKKTKFCDYHGKLHHFIRNMKYKFDLENLVNFFDEKGEFVYVYMITNWINVGKTIMDVNVGNFTPWAPHGQQLIINKQAISWKTKDNTIPVSQCSKKCLPGYRKVQTSSIHHCCYDCAPCSQGEISNVTDSNACIKCTEYEWPNEKKDHCIPKELDFLSYTDDVLTAVFALTSVLFCFITLSVFVIFVSYRDTPIVRANNQNLSFVLLVSIMSGFLCVFLFLGRPVDITCVLRQVSFGIIFSIAISSVLAKTIVVYIAFKATKPGNKWKKCIGVKVPNLIVLFFSSIQVIICISWLAVSPPFQELDTYSYQRKIIIQCNEGVVYAFYAVLGYMGTLTAVSFISAFLVKTLPDNFNEAKYITFSMLVFCSVWIAMVPAYLSTKGRYMVAVEVFAILASSVGLLGCLFFPKCYVIVFKPENNSKMYLRRSQIN
ncbi:vomeronasal type-2 receptor 26-like [Pelobates fuscus]|uniref:vomeronasal type-2 receptor 26-like n=1 Tax=Pelobates fuscus TaxID=191477 RepID=UPI002FE44A9B